MDYYKGIIPIIDDSPAPDVVDLANPKGVCYGYVERDYKLYPKEMFSPPSEMVLYSPAEWDALFDLQEETKSSLEHLYLSGPNGASIFENLDQNGDGYCWMYSNGHALMIDRLKANQPLVRLNPHSSAAIIKGGRDEGGWCGLGAKFLREHGMATEEFWPRHSRSLANDTPASRANMALHKVTEDYVDLTRDVYDQNLTKAQLATCLFNNIPCPVDFDWWGHSVCALRWVRLEAGSWGPLILNSWKGWGRYGLGVLRGSNGVPNGAVALRVSTASVK
jgi:hypothetical protein